MLTAVDGETDETASLYTGADDYLRKPFSYPVLVARCRALMRRGAAGMPAELVVDDLVLDPRRRTVRRRRGLDRPDPSRVRAPRVADANHDRPLRKQEILDHVWGPGYSRDANVVEVYVGYLRRKVDQPFGTRRPSRLCAARDTCCAARRDAPARGRRGCAGCRCGLRITLVTAAMVAVTLVVGGFLSSLALRTGRPHGGRGGHGARSGDRGPAAADELTNPLPVHDPETFAEVVQDGQIVAATDGITPEDVFDLPAQDPRSSTTYEVQELRSIEPGPYRVAARGVQTPDGPMTVFVAVSIEDAVDMLFAGHRDRRHRRTSGSSRSSRR